MERWTQANAMTQETSNYYCQGFQRHQNRQPYQTGRSIITEAIAGGQLYLRDHPPECAVSWTRTTGHDAIITSKMPPVLAELGISRVCPYVTLPGKGRRDCRGSCDELLMETPMFGASCKENCVLLWCSDVDTTAVPKSHSSWRKCSQGHRSRQGRPAGHHGTEVPPGEVIATVPLLLPPAM
ncbi:MAG: hypothetical protein ACLUSL_11615 [Ruminococcus sp.]